MARILEVPGAVHQGTWFPGRIVGGVALIVAPLVWLAGLLIRYLAVDHSTSDVEPLAAVAELAAYDQRPGMMVWGYGLFLAAALVMVFALITLGQLASRRCPRLALWGAVAVVVGICSRLYFAGVDHTAFKLVDRLGVEEATRIVRDTYVDISYGPLRVPVTIAFLYYIGLALLVVALIRSGTVGVLRGVVVFGAGLWVGVLKEAHLHEVVWLGLLAVAIAPLGVNLLRSRETAVPGRIRWLW